MVKQNWFTVTGMDGPEQALFDYYTRNMDTGTKKTISETLDAYGDYPVYKITVSVERVK